MQAATREYPNMDNTDEWCNNISQYCWCEIHLENNYTKAGRSLPSPASGGEEAAMWFFQNNHNNKNTSSRSDKKSETLATQLREQLEGFSGCTLLKRNDALWMNFIMELLT